MENQPAIIRGLVSAREETAILIMLVLSAAGVIWQRGTVEPTSTLWAALLAIQALPFLAALIMSMINVLPVFRWKRAMAPLPDLPTAVLPGPVPPAAGKLTTGR
jgi:hypothetical protein